MPVTGVYFIPSNPNAPTALATIVEQLRAAYNPATTGRWALEHKLLRDTASCLPPSAYAPLPPIQAPRSMQFLSMSRFQSHGFIYVSNRPNPDPWGPYTTPASSSPASNVDGRGHQVMPAAATAMMQGSTTLSATPQQPVTPSPTPSGVALPPPPQPQQPQQAMNATGGVVASADRTMMTLDPQSFGAFLSVTLRACEPLWCLRHTFSVPAGTSFSVADFHIRIGDVRQTHPINRIRGTVVEIEYRGPSSSSSALPFSTEEIETFGLDSVENILAPPPQKSVPFATSSPSKQKEEYLIPTDEDWEIGAVLIREFWSRFAVAGAREAILVPGVGTEAREALKQGKRRLTTGEAGDGNDGIAGVDLARQYMEVFRFNR